ncbi:MAG: STT3 domain-containing protein [Nanoarchaeota archaeon]|nr:STT3 domain-containing protein [Nanoarchaeota archaeon]
MDEEKIIEERKKKATDFVKINLHWIAYLLLAVVVYLAVKIRMLPTAIDPATGKPGLWDITTNNWTLGPDLDPFLFLRWAKYIVAHGNIMTIDTMRYVPRGFDTSREVIWQPYLIAWFHKMMAALGLSSSVEYSAVVYPVFMFGLAVIAFFLMTKVIFQESVGKKNALIIAVIASFFLSVIPSILPRTIAGIPEKEASGFVFLFLSFYLFISAWKAQKNIWKMSLALLAGIFTATMALVWGGYIYIFATISIAVFLSFIFGQVDVKKYYSYSVWLISASVIMYFYGGRYDPKNLLSSTSTAPAYILFLILSVHILLLNTKLKKYIESPRLEKIPKPILSLVIALVLGLVLSFIFIGPGFVPNNLKDAYHTLVNPQTDRLGLTVAENKQPYFTEWARSFGPAINGIPLFFWLFFVGSIYLYYQITASFEKKERLILTASYVFFLFATIFSRYSSNSTFNGTNMISILLYFLGFIVFVGSFGFYYYNYHKRKEEERLRKIDFGPVILFALFFLSIISARGAVRLIMMLVPPASVIVAYFAVASFSRAMKTNKNSAKRLIAFAIAILISISTIFSGYAFYQEVNGSARYNVPSSYTQQWQKAMFWVRENTPQNAVFGHWWDYGYWVQSIGERATVLDGGNAISYWNYLMGRYALTGPNEREALEFLYTHNTTHFLIDSSDIGKYSAFSSIGSDLTYDRASWLSTFAKDPKMAQETKNTTISVYTGGTVLDEDILYDNNGTRIFLPGQRAGIGAITVERDKNGSIVSQPKGVYVYQNNQYALPLRYIYDGTNLIDFGSGIEAGVFIYPRLDQQASGYQLDNEGAALYLSNKTVKSQLARLYLYKENDPYFVLVHTEDDFVVASIKAQNPGFKSDFVEYQGFRGPIRIWEIHYPGDMEVKQEYLQTDFIDSALTIAR